MPDSLADRLKQWDREHPWSGFIAQAVRGEIKSADDAYFSGLAAEAHAWFSASGIDELHKALGALADIGLNTDMSREQMQHKARRIYHDLTGTDPAI